MTPEFKYKLADERIRVNAKVTSINSSYYSGSVNAKNNANQKGWYNVDQARLMNERMSEHNITLLLCIFSLLTQTTNVPVQSFTRIHTTILTLESFLLKFTCST